MGSAGTQPLCLLGGAEDGLRMEIRLGQGECQRLQEQIPRFHLCKKTSDVLC